MQCRLTAFQEELGLAFSPASFKDVCLLHTTVRPLDNVTANQMYLVSRLVTVDVRDDLLEPGVLRAFVYVQVPAFCILQDVVIYVI